MDNMFLFWTDLKGSERSTSAGIFYYIATKFFELYPDLHVFGCVLDDSAVAMHRSISCASDLYLLQGSKYVQSNISRCFSEVKKYLDDGGKVLFSGTPCQVAAIKNYLGKDYKNLTTIDIICHGVPSPRLYKQYIEFLSSMYNGDIKNLKFRNKSKTNRLGYILTFNVNGKRIKKFPMEDVYYSAFMTSKSLRPSCYHCKFVVLRPGDVSIGDSNNKKFHPNEAISLLMINSEKGKFIKDLMARDKDRVQLIETTLAEESVLNKQLCEPASEVVAKERIYTSVFEHGFLPLKPPIKKMQVIMCRILDKIPTYIKDNVKKIMFLIVKRY